MKKAMVSILAILVAVFVAATALAESGSKLPWGSVQTTGQVRTLESGTKTPWQ